MDRSAQSGVFGVISALAVLSPATSSFAQQQTAPAAQQAPMLSPSPAVPAQAAPAAQAPAPSAAGPSAAPPAGTDGSARPVEGGLSPKSHTAGVPPLSAPAAVPPAGI